MKMAVHDKTAALRANRVELLRRFAEEIDPISNLHIPNFNFVLNHLIIPVPETPIYDNVLEMHNNNFARVRTAIDRFFGSQGSECKVDDVDILVMGSGSFAEGLQPMVRKTISGGTEGNDRFRFLPSAYDMMLSVETLMVHEITGISLQTGPDIHQGYAQIEIDKNRIQVLSNHLQDLFEEEENGKMLLSSKNFQKLFESPRHLPYVQASSEPKENEHDFLAPIYMVHCVPCLGWPQEARKWSQENSKADWPSPELADFITSQGCHLVPIAHAMSNNHDKEWRFSFFTAERALAKTLLPIQRKCYTLFRMICFDNVEKVSKTLASYHLKMVMFWMCEKVPFDTWSDDNLAKCILMLMDELIVMVRNQNIPSFFIPENNLLSHVEPYELQLVVNKLSSIREDPLSSFRTCHIQAFGDSIAFDDVYDAIIKILHSPNRNVQIQGDIMRFFLNVGNVYDVLDLSWVALIYYENALDTAEVLYREEDYGEQVIPMLKNLAGYAAHARDLDKAIHYHKRLLEYPQYLPGLEETIYRVNLACYLHAKANVLSGTDEMANAAHLYGYHLYPVEIAAYQRHECLQEAEFWFLQILERTFDHVALNEYANLLMLSNRPQDAILYLDQVIKHTEKRDPFAPQHCFTEIEKPCLCNDLRQEVDSCGEVRVWSTVYAYFLLVDCFLRCKEDEKASELMEKFAEETLKYDDDGSKGSSFTLLAYSYLKLNNFEEAEKAFQRAGEMDPQNDQTTRNILICQTGKLKLSTTDTKKSLDAEEAFQKAGQVEAENPEATGDIAISQTSELKLSTTETKESEDKENTIQTADQIDPQNEQTVRDIVICQKDKLKPSTPDNKESEEQEKM